jgi:glycosyltransferase 2 family protein
MSQKRQSWKTLLQIAFCLLLLAWIFHKIFSGEGRQACQAAGGNWDQLTDAQQWKMAWTIGPSELWRVLKMSPPGVLTAAALLALAMILLNVIRWRMVLEVQGLRLSFARATAITFIAQFFSTFMLGSAGGDLIKAYYAARETNHKKTEAVTTVFVDRLIGLWAMLLFASLMMLPNLKAIRGRHWLEGGAALILAMLAASTAILYLAFWGGLSKRLPQARPWLRRMPKGELLEKSLDSCRQFGRHKTFLLKSVAISLLVNIAVVWQASILADGLRLGIPLASISFIVPMIICVSALPITPGGFGVRENLYVLMFGEAGLAKTPALSLSLLANTPTLLWNLVGGIVYIGLKNREHLEEVTRPDPQNDKTP